MKTLKCSYTACCPRVSVKNMRANEAANVHMNVYFEMFAFASLFNRHFQFPSGPPALWIPLDKNKNPSQEWVKKLAWMCQVSLEKAEWWLCVRFQWSRLTCHPICLETSLAWRCWRLRDSFSSPTAKTSATASPVSLQLLKRSLGAPYWGSHSYLLEKSYWAVSELRHLCSQGYMATGNPCWPRSSLEEVCRVAPGRAVQQRLSSPQFIPRLLPLLSHLGEVVLRSAACWHCDGDCHNS